MSDRPDIVILMTDQERAIPDYEPDALKQWRHQTLVGRRWFDENGVRFEHHYTGSVGCVPARPTMFTGQYPDVHGVTQTEGLGKLYGDSRLRWLRAGEVPTLGHWFRAAGYDTYYEGKWHLTDADLTDPRTGGPLATNDSDGRLDPAAVATYRDADVLDPFGFSGWVGPEPHGPLLENSGLRRDSHTEKRVVAWLEDRYRARREGDADALRPFLLVASFVNPHDIVLFPAWAVRNPVDPSPLDPPSVPPPPTAEEDMSTKPAAQIAYRAAYPSAYGPPALISRIYDRNAQLYRDMYYRLHAEVDGPLDRVRRAVTEGGSEHAVLVRTSDHGDLLGSHGGLHQKWFTLYDEATRVPFVIARIGEEPTVARAVDMPSSHVDIVPTLLSFAGIDQSEISAELAQSFTEVHELPGRDLAGIIAGTEAADESRPVYMLSRDNVIEGDSGASRAARRLGRAKNPPAPMRIQVPAHVGSNFEGLVVRVAEADAPRGTDHLWKLVRTFDDPATWTEPGVRHLASDGVGGPAYRSVPLDDEWELYDLSVDPIEAVNRWTDPDLEELKVHLRTQLEREHTRSVPVRNQPWPYATRRPTADHLAKRPPKVARVLRRALQRLGLHPDDTAADPDLDLSGGRALIVCTNTGVLDVGKPTGVYASEMTAPYYVFSDAGMEVDIASPLGGVVPVDPLSLKGVLRCEHDDRFLVDDELRAKVTDSLTIGSLDVNDYDIVYLAGGWGAAFDFGYSEDLAEQMTRANGLGKAIGGVCHGPLGLLNATAVDGRPLVEGRTITAVTDKQVRELRIESTPHHPERELRAAGAVFESKTRRPDPLANHWVIDGNLVTGQNQNAGPMVARELMALVDKVDSVS